MFGRLLSFIGFLPGGLAGGFGGAGGEELESYGEAAVSFTPGHPLAPAEADETPDERRARITDRDLVWPGKVETIQVGNPEAQALRFDLTVTDLAPDYFIRRAPTGGLPQREGGVLLQPGEGAAFEVVFVPPPPGEKARTRTFSFVLTCFDPRRSRDAGDIVQDLPLRWVALPAAGDLQIAAEAPAVVTRPWRRAARFAVRLQNKSYLPPNVGLTILRAPTKDGLERSGETVGTMDQSLASRTPGVWQCLLPPPARRASFYATVRGVAEVAGDVRVPLSLPRPVLVRYVPWLRMGRDWLFLLVALLLLLWLVWGVPVRKTPVVRVSLAFAGLNRGEIPTDSRLQDLSAQMILLDERGHDVEGQTPLAGTIINGAYEFTPPSRWYGYRWAWGHTIAWNGWCRAPQRFRVVVTADDSHKGALKRFDLNTLEPQGTAAYSVATAPDPFGSWATPATFAVPAAQAIRVSLRLGALGALAGRDLRTVSVRYALDGAEQPTRTFQLLHDGAGGLRPLALDLTDQVPLGTPAEFTVKVTGLGLSSYDAQPLEVRRQDRPFVTTLSFPDSYPAVKPKPGLEPINKGAAQAARAHPKPARPGVPPRRGGGTQVAVSPDPKKSPIFGHRNIGGVTPGKRKPLVVIAGLPPPKPFLPPVPAPQPLKPPRPAAPLAPGHLTAEAAGPSQVDLRWDGVAAADHYVLYRSAARDQDAGRGKVVQYLGRDATGFSDKGLNPGVTYSYRVQAKSRGRYSPFSNRTSAMTRAPLQVPVTVALSLAARGHDLYADMEFANVSGQEFYLDKVSACLGGKIGDGVFQVEADGQPLPFTGQRSKRRTDPGARQFVRLAPGASQHVNVALSRAYRLLPGTHTYRVVYVAAHDFAGHFQSVTLRSDAAQAVLTR
jgi:hypothetical protein